MEVTIAQAYDLMLDAIKAGLVINLSGSPGIGKSDLTRKVAHDFNLKVIDIRLSQCDPTDLNGFPFVDPKTGRSGYAPPMMFPLEGDPLPEILDANGKGTGKFYDGWMIFFDELSSASMAVQAASYKVMLDREIGQHKLHPRVAMVCAGNLATDRAVVNRMSTAMQSRLIHLNLVPDIEGFVEWAYQNGIDRRIIAFLLWRPELLHKFDPKHDDNTYPCSRTWYFLSKLIKQYIKLDEKKQPLYAGTVGEGTSFEFVAFAKVWSTLPTIDKILADPNNVVIPDPEDDPSILFALSTMLGEAGTDMNLPTLMKVIDRMPPEFQSLTMTRIIKSNTIPVNNKILKKWSAENSDELM